MPVIPRPLLAPASFAVLTMTSLSGCLAQTPIKKMPDGVYHLDPAHASLIWKVSHLGLSDYTARFTDFDAELTFDPTDIEDSNLVATIEPTSIETDYPYPEKKNFDKELAQGEKWFNAKEFPTIRFESTNIKKVDDTRGIVTGNLTFLGQTHPMTLNVTFNKAMAEQPFSNNPTLGFSATGTLKRSKWGMDTYTPTIGNEVELLIEAELAHTGEPAELKGN